MDSMLMDSYDSFSEKKEESKEASSTMSAVVKDFATDTLGDKKLKKYVKAYMDNMFKADYTEFSVEQSLYESIAKNFLSQFDPDSKVTEEKLTKLYNEYSEIKRQKSLIASDIAGVIESCALAMNREKPEIRTFFNYRYQKEKNGESPIDSIDEFQAMLEEA